MMHFKSCLYNKSIMAFAEDLRLALRLWWYKINPRGNLVVLIRLIRQASA